MSSHKPAIELSDLAGQDLEDILQYALETWGKQLQLQLQLQLSLRGQLQLSLRVQQRQAWLQPVRRNPL